MEKESKFDDRESLTIPVNYLFAIVMDPDEANGIVETLIHNGFSPEDIGVLTGMEDAAKLDAVSGEKGFFAKLVISGIDMGDRDSDYIKRYRRALLNGRTVVTVTTKIDLERNKASQILKAHGARFITFFGRFVTEVLEA